MIESLFAQQDQGLDAFPLALFRYNQAVTAPPFSTETSA
jgi:hypothetical protein